jgi:vacuolar protein sorting-associated protein 35
MQSLSRYRPNSSRNVNPDRLDYVDQVLTYASQKVAQHVNSADLHSQTTQANILRLLMAPVKAYLSLFTALSLPSFIPLFHSQPYSTRRGVAGELAKTLLKNQTRISSVENLESVLQILRVLIREGMQQPPGYPGGPAQRKGMETEETIEEQGWLARLIHLIHNPNNNIHFTVSVESCGDIDTFTNSSNHSCYKQREKPSPRATSASDTQPQPC